LALFKTNNRVSAQLDEETIKRLPDRLNKQLTIQWFFRAVTHTPQELAKICWENPEEAQEVGEFIQEALRRIFEAQQIAKERKGK
jgi:hypothetical protein